MRFLITLLFSSFVVNAYAQRQNVYYLKNSGRLVFSKDSADYIRIVREPDSGAVMYKVMEYYTNGVLKFVGASSEVDPVKLEGTCISYFKTGKRKTIFNYKKGFKLANQYYYHPNGQLLEIRNYPDSINLNKEIYRVITLNDSTGKAMVTDGNGHYVSHDENFKKVISEGDLKNGLKHGKWLTSIKNDSIITDEDYSDGVLINGTAKFTNGEVSNYKEVNRLPQYPGGAESLARSVAKALRYPEQALSKRMTGQVIVSFTIQADGSLTDVKALDPNPGRELSDEAVRVLKLTSKWEPAMEYGRAVKHTDTFPISFNLQGR